MRIIVIGAHGLAAALAAHLHLEHVQNVHEIASDGFVLDGDALSVDEARALDVVLRSRAAEVEAVLWLSGGDPAVLERYHGRIIELDPAAAFDSALDGLREVLLAA
jgi:adenylate kinase family enzyme